MILGLSVNWLADRMVMEWFGWQEGMVMKVRMVEVREGEFLGPIDWLFDFDSVKWADVEGACVLCAKGLLDVDGVHRVGNDLCRCASPAYAARETQTQWNAREELRAEWECRKMKG